MVIADMQAKMEQYERGGYAFSAKRIDPKQIERDKAHGEAVEALSEIIDEMRLQMSEYDNKFGIIKPKLKELGFDNHIERH